MKNFTIRVLIVVLGSILMSIGITLYLQAALGLDPLSIFVSGVSKVTNLSYGTASQSWMGVLMVIVFFLERKRLGWGTVINALLIGWFVDFFLDLGILQPEAMVARVLTLSVAAVFMAIGIGVYVSGGLGEGAMEAVMVILQHRTKINLQWVKIGMDVCLVIVGTMLGGQLGIGTLVGVLATGPIVERTINIMNRLDCLNNSETV